MATETAATGIPPEISAVITKLNADVEGLQRELQQAMDVWQTTLASEKERYEELLKHKELAWREQEEQWAKQTQVYEERLDHLQSEFDSRIKKNEDYARHALTELDDSWQRDKLEWAAAPGVPSGKVRELEEKVVLLERRLAEQEKMETEEAARYDAAIQELRSRIAPADAFVQSCVDALDHQITVLYDLVHFCAQDKPNDGPSLNLVNP